MEEEEDNPPFLSGLYLYSEWELEFCTARPGPVGPPKLFHGFTWKRREGTRRAFFLIGK